MSNASHLRAVAEAWEYMEGADQESVDVCLAQGWIKRDDSPEVSETEGYVFTKAGRQELARQKDKG